MPLAAHNLWSWLMPFVNRVTGSFRNASQIVCAVDDQMRAIAPGHMFQGQGQQPLELMTANELNISQTQDSLDRLATACERLLVIVVVIAVLLGVFLIGFVVKKVHSNHSGGGPPKMTEETQETTMTTERSGNDVRH